MAQDPPVRYVGDEGADPSHHHGGLRPAVGVHSYQMMRANRTHPEWADGWGWTYNHAPMLAYWHGRFYLEYLSDPVGEHMPPSHTLLATSADGRHWARPQVIFPSYVIPDGVYDVRAKPRLAPGSHAVMHQRMGFYVAPNDRLLVLGFYGICAHPHDGANDGTGIGRVVREVYDDGAYGPIYFLRYNRHAGWNETNTRYPYYAASGDTGFVDACRAMLADRLATLQWWEEDRSRDGFYAVEGGKALSYYHLPDGRVVGLWKFSRVAISADEGQSWSDPVESPSLVMAGAKVWGQRTSDGRYALVYNPSRDNTHRWPLAVVTGDGTTFGDMALVNGEVPPRRFLGRFKDFGLNYVRGIAEGNGQPPDGALWVTYSMNKEDIWVSRIPVPVRREVRGPVHDAFDDIEVGEAPEAWNLYAPLWAPVAVAGRPDGGGRALALRDSDPYDYARAERVFAQSPRASARLRLLARPAPGGGLHVEVLRTAGGRAIGVVLDGDGRLWAVGAQGGRAVAAYPPGAWLDLELVVDVVANHGWVLLNGASVASDVPLGGAGPAVSRLVLRTGPQRTTPALDTDRHGGDDLPGADEPVAESVYCLSSAYITG